jgi:hypothetical protein
MQKKTFPTPLFLFILAIFIFQALATYFYWYWRIRWIDKPMHFMGGLWIGLSALWFYVLSGRFAPARPIRALQVVIVGTITVLLVAILWEIFEYFVYLEIPQVTPYSMSDTLSDIAFGVLGGLAASLVFLKRQYGNHMADPLG